jgi:hypothetical protein
MSDRVWVARRIVLIMAAMANNIDARSEMELSPAKVFNLLQAMMSTW